MSTNNPSAADTRLQAIQALLAELDQAGEHFRRSRQELMLGIRAVLVAIEDTDVGGNPLQSYTHWAMPYLVALRTVIDIGIARDVNQAQTDAPLAAATTEALSATREFFVRYLMRLDPGQAGDERRALLAVLAILDQEIEHRAFESQAKVPRDIDNQDTKENPDNRIKWIEVEG